MFKFFNQKANIDAFKTASLDLNFSKNKSLVDSASRNPFMVSYVSTTAGTYVGSDGLIKTAAANLLTYSQMFENVVWTKNGTTFSMNAALAPDGTLTADKMVETTSTGVHRIGQGSGKSSTAMTYTFSVYAKAGERTTLELGMTDGGGWSEVFVNLLNGSLVIPVASSTNAWTSPSVVVTPVSNGWYRVAITATTTADSTINVIIGFPNTGTNNNFTGDGTSGLYIWGAQLEASATPSDYVTTTSSILYLPRFDHDPITKECKGLLIEGARTNLITYSEQFDSADWTKSELTVTTNTTSTLAPDGSYNSDVLIPTTNNAGHEIKRLGIFSGAGTYTDSVYAKSTGYAVLLSSADSGGYVAYNLASGTILATSGGATGTITAMGNGWYRCSTTRTTTGAASLYWQIRPDQSTYAYIGNGTSGIAFWGAQIEAAIGASSYIPTTTAAVTRTENVARVAGTNFFTYSEQFDNASGWNSVGLNTVSADVTTSPNGLSSADAIVENTGNSQHRVAQTPTTSAGVYTFSVYAKQGSGTRVLRLASYLAPNGTSDGLASFNLSNGTYATGQGTATMTSVGNGWYRCSITTGSISANTGFYIGLAITDYNTFIYAGDGTSSIYLWGAQLEPFGVIGDYTATAVLNSTTYKQNVFRWLTANLGTIYGEGSFDSVFGTDGYNRLVELANAVNGNSLSITRLTNGSTGYFAGTTNSVTQIFGSFAITQGTAFKAVMRYMNNNAVAYALPPTKISTPVLTSASCTIPPLTSLCVGGENASNGRQTFGPVKRIAYWPYNLTDQQLMQVTTSKIKG